MKRLVGGDYLLDLSSIELEESEDGSTKTNITDADVLAQLTNLKKYIKNPEMAKPVWVKLVNGENDELVIARGTFAVVDTGEFEICVQLDGYKLVIFIEFTQATLSDDTPIDDWYIDTNDAKYLFTSDAQNVKATIEDANFGDVELAGDLSVGGDLSVTGKVNGKIAFEDIEDASGNKRFVEGNLTGSITGATFTYAKWSLSGSHLMFVLAGKIDANTEIGSATFVYENNTIPAWVKSKIYPSGQSERIICAKESDMWYDNTLPVSSKLYVALQFLGASDNRIAIATWNTPAWTNTSDVYFRIVFDLLIDNASA